MASSGEAGHGRTGVRKGGKARALRKERALPLTVSRKDLLTHGSDHAFRELVHELFAFLARHEEIRSGP